MLSVEMECGKTQFHMDNDVVYDCFADLQSFDDLDITDPIMFGLVFSNKHIAKPFIEHFFPLSYGYFWTWASLLSFRKQGK